MSWNSIILEVSSVCNLKCQGCVFTMQFGKRKLELMNLQDACRCLQLISESGLFTEVALFGYGEPMLHPDIASIVAKATELSLSSYISTNGNYKQSNSPLFDSGLNRLLFSIDGFTQETYGKFRVGGSFDWAIKNLVEVDNINKERGFPMVVEYQIIGLKHIPDEEIKRARIFCESLNRVHFKCKTTLSKKAKGRKNRKKLIKKGKINPWGTCKTPMIRYDGTVGLCCRDWNVSRGIGDLKTTPPVEILALHPRRYDPDREICVRKCPYLRESYESEISLK